MSEYVDFHYMPLEGKITGEQVLKQTEDAINDLGNKVYSLDIDQSEIDEAVEKSNEAINTANSALAAVTTGRSVWFNNVAEMVATDIEAGVTAETKGYYVANDGGNALYLIRQEKSGDVVDGGSLIALDNGNMAELVTDGTVNVKQFGAIGNGTDDDTTVFQNTSSYAQAKGFVPFVGVATYKITGSVTGTFNSFGEVTITGGEIVDIINLQEVVSDVSDIRDEVVDETASAKAYSESAATSATNAFNSESSASTTARQLMDYLATKETLTAPAVDPTLSISGAAADAKVTGDTLNTIESHVFRDVDYSLIKTADSYYASSSGGTINSYNGYVRTDAIQVHKGDIVTVVGKAQTAVGVMCVCDPSNTVRTPVVAGMDGYADTTYEYNVAYDCYLCFSFKEGATIRVFKNYYTSVNSLQVAISDIEDNRVVKTKSANLWNGEYDSDVMITTSSISSVDGYNVTKPIYLTTGTYQYNLLTSSYGNTYDKTYCSCSPEGDFVKLYRSTKTDVTYTYGSVSPYIYNMTVYTVTIYEDGYYRFNCGNSGPKQFFMFVKNNDATTFPQTYVPYKVKIEEGVNLSETLISEVTELIASAPVTDVNYKGGEMSTFSKCLCIGDSLTSGVFNKKIGGVTQYFTIPKYSYPTILTKLSNVETANMGDGGQTTKSWYERHSSVTWAGYDMAIVALGTNDAGEITKQETQTYMTNIINKLKTDNDGIKIFVCTVLPVIYARNVAFADVNDAIATAVDDASSDVYLVDMTDKSAIRNEGAPYVNGHLTALGYALEAKELYNYISYIIHENANDFAEIQFINWSE